MVLNILQKNVPQYAVWAFGSRAKWTAKDYSDLDLCVVSDKPLSFSILGALAEDFSDSDLPWKVDVVDWATVSESFRKIIERDKVVVQVAKTGRVMAGEWHTLRLGNVCRKIGSGATPRGGSNVYLERGDVALIRSQNVYNEGLHRDGLVYLTEQHAAELANVQVEENDVLLNITGDSVARSCQVAPDVLPARVNQHVAIIRPDPSVLSPRYLRYYLVSPSMQAEMLGLAAVGATRNALTKGMIESFEVPAPVDVEEQRAIAHILGTLDDKIELNRRVNETLEAIARAIFKSWFIDFDPVRAKASGEPPESICQRLGLTPDLLALFPDRFVDSEIGDGSTSLTTGIPEGWEIGSIGDHCYLNAESWTIKTMPNEVHYVDLANAKNGIVSEVQVFLSSTAPSRARRVLRAGDTIVGIVRPGNRSFSLIGEGAPQLTGSTGFAVLTPKRPELRELVYFLSTGDENIDRLSRLADGAAYPAVRPEVVTAGTCVVPTPGVIDAFHEAIGVMIDYQMVNQIGSNTLAATRDTLLPKLLTGELRVPVVDAV